MVLELSLRLLRQSKFSLDIGKQIAENASDKVQNILEVIAIGLDSMIFLRVSLIHIQRDDREISIGPSYLLNVLLEFTSNRMSRRRAVYIDETVREMMATVDWEKAKKQLPSCCFSLMNTSAEQQKSFSQELTSLGVKSMDENTKKLALGIMLLELFGKDVLESALSSLNPSITLSRDKDDSI